MEKSMISLVIVMLTNKDSSNFNWWNVNYEGILNEKVRFEEKSKLRGKLKDSSNFNKGNVHYERILNGKSQISFVIVMLTTKDSSNFNRVNVNYEGTLNEKK